MPSREALERAKPRLLKHGGRYKADLLEADLGQGPMVIKDYVRKRWFVRLIGRLQVRRESSAYRRLARLEGIPDAIGRIDACALAVEKVTGRPLSDSTCPPPDGRAIYDRLAAVVAAMHRRGLVHLDLRTRKNVVIGPDRQVFLVDFASALWLSPGGLAHRLLFRRLARIDDAALLKWKQMLNAGPFTPEESRFLRRFDFWRSLWIFHPPSRGEE